MTMMKQLTITTTASGRITADQMSPSEIQGVHKGLLWISGLLDVHDKVCCTPQYMMSATRRHTAIDDIDVAQRSITTHSRTCGEHDHSHTVREILATKIFWGAHLIIGNFHQAIARGMNHLNLNYLQCTDNVYGHQWRP